MIEVDIPGFGQLHLQHAVFDVNGTLAIDGQPIEGIGAKLDQLALHVRVHLLSALTHGNQAVLEDGLRRPILHIEPGREAEQKAGYVRRLGAERCVAIGNGRNDILMLEAAVLGIAVLDKEGVAAGAFQAADVVVADAGAAIDLLLLPHRLLATLRS
jgi:soluble P-type ATPase